MAERPEEEEGPRRWGLRLVVGAAALGAIAGAVGFGSGNGHGYFSPGFMAVAGALYGAFVGCVIAFLIVLGWSVWLFFTRSADPS